jgi:hypothetical protein
MLLGISENEAYNGQKSEQAVILKRFRETKSIRREAKGERRVRRREMESQRQIRERG